MNKKLELEKLINDQDIKRETLDEQLDSMQRSVNEQF